MSKFRQSNISLISFAVTPSSVTSASSSQNRNFLDIKKSDSKYKPDADVIKMA